MDKNPFDKVLDQIAEIMQFAYDNAHKPIPPNKAMEVESKLAELEDKVQALKNMAEKTFEGSELSDYVVESMFDDEKISKEDRDILKRAQTLKSEAEVASKDALKAATDAKESGKQLTEKKKAKPKSHQARKGKFKSMGGYKDWKPL